MAPLYPQLEESFVFTKCIHFRFFDRKEKCFKNYSLILLMLPPFHFSRELLSWNQIKRSCSKLKPKYFIETYGGLSHDQLLVKVLISSGKLFFIHFLFCYSLQQNDLLKLLQSVEHDEVTGHRFFYVICLRHQGL